MPTYGYTCDKCGHEFDKYQSMSDKPLTVCPKELCGQKKWGKGKVRKAIGAGAGLIFKGSGFYITDYRSEGYKAAAKKDSGTATGGGESKGAAGSEGKSAPATDSKPAPKPAAKTPKAEK